MEASSADTASDSGRRASPSVMKGGHGPEAADRKVSGSLISRSMRSGRWKLKTRGENNRIRVGRGRETGFSEPEGPTYFEPNLNSSRTEGCLGNVPRMYAPLLGSSPNSVVPSRLFGLDQRPPELPGPRRGPYSPNWTCRRLEFRVRPTPSPAPAQFSCHPWTGSSPPQADKPLLFNSRTAPLVLGDEGEFVHPQLIRPKSIAYPEARNSRHAPPRVRRYLPIGVGPPTAVCIQMSWKTERKSR